MTGQTDVFLITGFLGSGKTTLLNRLTKAFPPATRLMILMNEFGDIGIDGRLIETDDLDILEISKGSIFCVCVKTDFIKGLMRIATDIRPDVLFIEATGVADPTTMKRDLELSVFSGRFRLREQLCVIDARHFKDAYDTFVTVEKQIASATRFILNKVDLASSARIREAKEIIRRHHSDPVFWECTYGDIPVSALVGNMIGTAEKVHEADISPEAFRAALEDILKEPLPESLPPDALASAAYDWRGDSPEALMTIADEFPAGIIRAKGFVACDTGTFLFSWVMGTAEMKQVPPDSRSAKTDTGFANCIVFIGSPEALSALDRMSRRFPLTSRMPTRQPFALLS